MQKEEADKIILQKIQIIRDKFIDLDKNIKLTNNFNVDKNIQKINEELDKISYYYGVELSENNMNFAIKKNISIKKTKQSTSFFKWMFNNNEM